MLFETLVQLVVYASLMLCIALAIAATGVVGLFIVLFLKEIHRRFGHGGKNL